jgi:hypothetical protein
LLLSREFCLVNKRKTKIISNVDLKVQRPNQKTVTTMTDQQVLETLEITLKRHRGKPLHIETKQNIVKDLLRQRQERATLMANNGKRRTTTNQIAIARTTPRRSTINSK